jgi:hypothetical protein
VLNETNVISFGRAKNRSVDDSNNIRFNLEINKYAVEIVVTGNDDDSTVKVLDFIVRDQENGFLFEFDFRMDPFGYATAYVSAFVPEKSAPETFSSDFAVLRKEIHAIESLISIWSQSKFSNEFLTLNDQLNQLRSKLTWQEANENNKFSNRIVDFSDSSHSESNDKNSPDETDKEPTNDSAISFGKTELSVNLKAKGIFDLADVLLEEVESCYESVKGKEAAPESIEEFYLSYKNAYDFRKQWAKSLRGFAGLLRNRQFYYIGATSMKQNSLMSIKDTANPLAVAVHEYYQNRLHKSDYNDFVVKWFRLFEIGDAFSIHMHEGEAYSVNVISGNYSVPIADKGMGSIQAFIILLKIAYIAWKMDDGERATILLEEPEMNLHPALQSMLAELFLDAFEKFKIDFVAETHSEYLIRATQLLVKKNDFEIKPNDNPFGVIYFDKDEKQWRMNYREDGKFVEDFGQGFYNESARLTIDLL